MRLTGLAEQPYWMDEGYTINAVLSIFERGETVLDSGKYYACPTYCYPTAAIARVFGAQAFSYRLFAALAGTLFIAVIFFIARGLFTIPVALFASAFTAFSYFQIAWSRQARWYTLFELLFWLALFAFYKALYGEGRRTQTISALVCAGATVLAIATHGLGVLLLGIFFVWALIDRFFIRTDAGALPILLTLLGGVALLLFSGTTALLISNIDFYNGAPYYLGFYLSSYWLFFVLSAVALWRCRATPHARAAGFILFAVAAYAIPVMSMTQVIHYRYLFCLTPALFIFAGLGIEELRRVSARPAARAALVGSVFILFFTAGGGVLTPGSTYFLEADDPELLPGLPYYAYTPQPDWNAAYEFVISHRVSGDIVISSMPQFNKIFLGEAGYWITYSYLGYDTPKEAVEDGREYYVGAKAIGDLPELAALTGSAHGYVVLDYMAADGRIPQATLDYLEQNFERVFSDKVNSYSQVWVYKF
jgi:4-amino-4-deoxy-L-arabinose transferase-like glycosyltransferase